MAKDIEEKKMTLEEYEEKFSKPENLKSARTFLFLFGAAIGVIIFTCLLMIVSKIYEMNKYVGYGAAGLAVLIFIIVYIIPVVKIKNTKAFITNVDATNAKKAQKYNKVLREEIADKMIDLKAKTDGVSWYSDKCVGNLAIARQTKDDKALKNALTEIYKTDVKDASNKMIRDHALKVGLTTGISQSEKLDTLFVCVYELNLIKDIVFLYGYRPSDAKMAKIYKEVLLSALAAYGLNGATSSVAKGVVKKLGNASKAIPIIGGALGTVVDSTLQATINASLTVIIGFETKKYLKREYKLQDILDEIDVPDTDEQEQEEMLAEVKEKTSKKQPAMQEA